MKLSWALLGISGVLSWLNLLIVFFCTGVANRDFGLKSDAQVSQTVLFGMSKS